MVLSPGEPVQVEGLRELSRALKKYDDKLSDRLKEELKAGADMAALKAKARIPRGPGRRPGHAANFVKGMATRSGRAYVKWGRKTLPYAGWLEFGGTIDQRPVRNRQITRPRRPEGYYVYPAVRDQQKNIARKVEQSIDKINRLLGF